MERWMPQICLMITLSLSGTPRPLWITISGPSGTGKSILARKLSRTMANQGITSEIVELDGYLRSKEYRRRLITSYAIPGYELGTLRADLMNLQSGIVIPRRIYIPERHLAVTCDQPVSAFTDVVILDGVISHLLFDLVFPSRTSFGIAIRAASIPLLMAAKIVASIRRGAYSPRAAESNALELLPSALEVPSEKNPNVKLHLEKIQPHRLELEIGKRSGGGR